MIDANKPLENPQLVAAMEALQANPVPETEQAFLSRLPTASFLLLLQEAPAVSGGGVLEPGSRIKIAMLTDTKGQPLHFAFTDWNALGTFCRQDTPHTLIVPFSHLSALALGEGKNSVGILLNPGSHGLYLSRELLAHLRARPVAYTVEEGAQVLIGEPPEHPRALAESVAAALGPLENVRRAWLLLMVKGDEQSFLIVADFDGDRETVSRAIGSAAAPHLPAGMFVDVASYTGEFGRGAAQGKAPFYRRETR